jgi:hypothetical protein
MFVWSRTSRVSSHPNHSSQITYSIVLHFSLSIMFSAALLTVAALLPAAIAGPVSPAARSLSKRDLKAYAEEVTIHSSCNVTQSRQLQKALADTFEITAFAQKCKPISYPCCISTLLISPPRNFV